MIIPSKFNGFHDGVRRCFGGGGGGGGGGDAASAANGGDGIGGMGTGVGDGPVGSVGSAPGAPGGDGTNYDYTSTTNRNTGNTANTGVNTNRGVITGMNFTGGNTGGYGGPGINTTQGMATLGAAKGTPWGQSGAYYNDLLNQGFSSDQIRNSASSMYGAPSDANWGAMVQNAAMTSPTGRPMAGSDQFFQPVYNTSYMNYARPATQFDVSTYGTQPVYSPARAWNDRNSGSAAGGQQVVNNAIGNYFQQNPNSDINSTLNAMRGVGINRTDIQSWGGVNNYGPQMSMPQMQTPFNPYTNSSGYGGFGGYGMQTPFSYQQQYNPYQMQSPFSYQQPAIPPNYGPSQAIVSRSAQARGTPNVMRRAEGGIASLMDNVE